MNINQYNEDALEWVVTPEQAGGRVDKFITDNIDDNAVSRTQVQEWIKASAVQVNGQVVKTNYRVLENDTISTASAGVCGG